MSTLVGWTLVAGFVVFATGAARWRLDYERPLAESLPIIHVDRRRRAWIHLWMMPALVLTTAGLGALPPLTGDDRGAALATIGFVAYALGATCMVVSLAFGLTVTPWAAEQTVATGEVPSIYIPLDRWTRLLYVAHMATAYLTFTIGGTALLVGGAHAAWLGWLGVGLGLLGLGGFAATKAAGPFNPPILAHLWTLVVGIVLLT